METETCDFEVVVVNTSDKAILVRFEDDDDPHRKVWIPRSQIDSSSEIDDMADKGDSGTLTIPLWLAKEKGLVE